MLFIMVIWCIIEEGFTRQYIQAEHLISRPRIIPRFDRCYVCFDRTKKAMRFPSRSFIGLYGCHLKHGYDGLLIIDVGRAPNDQYLPIVFRVVETESKDTWSLFMKLLLEDIGENLWCFISDQQKGMSASYCIWLIT